MLITDKVVASQAAKTAEDLSSFWEKFAASPVMIVQVLQLSVLLADVEASHPSPPLELEHVFQFLDAQLVSTSNDALCHLLDGGKIFCG